MFFGLQPERAVINDINTSLMCVYQVIRDHTDELIEELKQHKNEADYFYKIRNWDRDKEAYDRKSDIQKASRIIYLNKTCYNGLFRAVSYTHLDVYKRQEERMPGHTSEAGIDADCSFNA